MHPKFSAALLTAALLAVSATNADAIVIASGFQNGNFAMTTCPSPNYCTYSSGDSTDITGWSVTHGSVDLITGYWQPPPLGGNSIDLDGNSPGAIAQTFSTIVGQTYQVSFYLSGNPDGGSSTKTLNSAAVGDPLFIYLTGSNTHSNMDYVLESYNFTAADPVTTLSFTSQDSANSPYGPVIGDVSVNAVPEPVTLSIFGAGLLGMAGLRRRKKLKA